jgi:hypothetical protein
MAQELLDGNRSCNVLVCRRHINCFLPGHCPAPGHLVDEARSALAVFVTRDGIPPRAAPHGGSEWASNADPGEPPGRAMRLVCAADKYILLFTRASDEGFLRQYREYESSSDSRSRGHIDLPATLAVRRRLWTAAPFGRRLQREQARLKACLSHESVGLEINAQLKTICRERPTCP